MECQVVSSTGSWIVNSTDSLSECFFFYAKLLTLCGWRFNHTRAAMVESTFEVVAVYPYQSAEKNQISLSPKEKILVLRSDSSGWWIGKNSKGEVGIFPSTYTSLGQNKTNEDDPLWGLDKNNKAVLWKVIDQLFRDKRQLQTTVGHLQDDVKQLQERLIAAQKIPLAKGEETLSEPSAPGCEDSAQECTPDPSAPSSEAVNSRTAMLESQVKELTQQVEWYQQVVQQHDVKLQEGKSQWQETQKESKLYKEQKCKIDTTASNLQSAVRDLSVRHQAMAQSVAQELQCFNQLWNDFAVACSGIDEKFAEVNALYRKEAKERKALYNMIQDLKGKVRVYCRVRPQLPQEKKSDAQCVAADDSVVRVEEPKKPAISYEFDACFVADQPQQVIFEEIQGVITSVLDGYNVCVFAYGQTGSGKTYTMEGVPGNRGITYRTVDRLFEQIESRKPAYHYTVSLTVIEVYNENIYDILRKGNREDRLEMRTYNGRCQVLDAATVSVSNAAEVTPILNRAFAGRSCGSTALNERSSRSHCLLTFYITGVNMVSKTKVTGKLNLIDLAGSERTAKSKAEGERLCEANCINRSLSNLGRVICALHQKATHIPYRDSKLTLLLQDSLSRDSKTILIANIGPSLSCASETLSTLAFASSVRKLELGEAKRSVTSLTTKRRNSRLRSYPVGRAISADRGRGHSLTAWEPEEDFEADSDPEGES